MNRRNRSGDAYGCPKSGQSWDPERYARHARFVSDLGTPLIELLGPQSHERILDLGCGDGVLSVILSERAGEVVCIDSSPEQVAAAQQRGLAASVADAHHLAFQSEFDAVWSNAALHWMTRPAEVLDGVWRALKPGGRFVAEMGGAGNVEQIKAALVAALERRGIDGNAHVPWYFPTVGEYRTLLEQHGFEVRQIDLIPRPTPLPGDIAGWFETFAEPFLASLDPDHHVAYIAEVRSELRSALCDAAGNWTADYVRLRFAAIKPH
ncbi:MAG: methyltransferase domain-containing protein [Alphaproteobacteria bacterium]|nr:methyltransferase domain-containing protein [Alphaproteobacteria bacterium]